MKIRPLSQKWGRFPIYQAKIGTGPSDCVIVKRTRDFHVGQKIEFCRHSDLVGIRTNYGPPWAHGVVWKIEDDRLFIARF